MVTPEFEEWLRAVEVPVEDTATRERYLTYLEEELGLKGGSLDIARYTYERDITTLAEHGIRAVPIKYRWGKTVRYGVQGISGLWGWASVQRIREAEEW